MDPVVAPGAPDLAAPSFDGGVADFGSSLLERDHTFPFGHHDAPAVAPKVQDRAPAANAPAPDRAPSAAPLAPASAPLDLAAQPGAPATSADGAASADSAPFDGETGAFAMGGAGVPMDPDVASLAIPILGQQVNLDQNLLDFARFRDRLAAYGRECATALMARNELKLPTRKVLSALVEVEYPRYLARAKDILYEEFSQRQVYGFSQEAMDRYIFAYAHRIPDLVQAALEAAAQIDEGVDGRRAARSERSRQRNAIKHQNDVLRDRQMYGGSFEPDAALARGVIHVGRSAGSLLGNAVKNLGSKSIGTVRKGLVYRQANQAALAAALREDITDLSFILGQALEDSGSENPYYTLENRSQAIQLREQLDANLVPFEQRRGIALRMLTTYPFDTESYQSVLRIFPEERQGVEAMTRWLRVDLGDGEL